MEAEPRVIREQPCAFAAGPFQLDDVILDVGAGDHRAHDIQIHPADPAADIEDAEPSGVAE